MVNNQCYVCNSIVTFETNSAIRDKYFNIIGNKLYPGSHLCFICTHMTQKLWSFRNTCLNRGVDVQYGCEEELNWSLLFRLTKDGEKPHNLEISNVRLTIICPEIKCQAKESVPINIESLDHDIIQELCINEDILPVHNVHDNYFNDFDHYVNHSAITESIDYRHNSIDSSFDDLNQENYFLEVNNIQKVDYFSNSENINDNYSKDSFGNSNNNFKETNKFHDNEDFNESNKNINSETNNSDEIVDESVDFRGSNKNIVNETNNSYDIVDENKDFRESNKNTNNSQDIVDENEDFRKYKKNIDEETNSSHDIVNENKDFGESHKILDEERNKSHDENEDLRESNKNTAEEVIPLQNTVLSENTECKYKIDNTNEQLDNEPEIKEEKHNFTKITLTLKEQKDILENLRKERKYIEAEYKCHSCALSFLFKDSYQSHMVRHEESNGQYSCSLCGLRFATANARRMHIPLHCERYVCSLCYDVLPPVRRKKHMLECWRIKIDPMACHLCGKMYQDSSGLQQHLKRFHQAKKKNRNYTCNTCGKTYNDQSALRTHLIKHANRRYECPQCPSTFSSPYTLQMHKKCHDFNLQQYCADCGKWYKTRKHLMEHLKVNPKHQQTSFECPICGRIRATRRSLDRHIQGAHSSDKPYHCLNCPARYQTKKSLLRHCQIHQQYVRAKEFICHLCGKSYQGKSKLTRHLRNVCERPKLETFPPC